MGANFDTGNVTNMAFMFYGCGQNSAVFTLDLGDKFDTSNVTNMAHMFQACGQNSTVFTLDLGENFDTGSVTNMTYMFSNCGCSSTVFTLDLGDKFDTSNVTDMSRMFFACGDKGTKFTTLDLSGFTVSSTAKLTDFAMALNVGTFIFGEGWAAATLPEADAFDYWADSISEKFPTMVIGATDNLLGYNWQSDSRVLIVAHIVTASAGEGGTVSGGGAVETGGSITLTATANDGYTFEGWYDGGTKVCETAVFVVENVTADQTYTAQFTAEAVVPDPEPGTEPDPEPVWEKPYLSWDGTTLTLTDHAAVTNKVGIVYTGGALFDAGAIDWYELVAAGKEYKSLNGTSGYAVYPDFTSRTPKTTGNYVAFVKYAQEDGLLTADYITFSVGGAQSFRSSRASL